MCRADVNKPKSFKFSFRMTCDLIAINVVIHYQDWHLEMEILEYYLKVSYMYVILRTKA